MTADPTIPFGYKRVFGQLQRGDGVWDGEKFVPARKKLTEVIITKTKMLWPCAMPNGPVAIRRCEPIQTEIPGAESVETMEVE